MLSVAIGHAEFGCCKCRCTVRAETWMRQLCVRYVLDCSEYGAVWYVAMKQLELQVLSHRVSRSIRTYGACRHVGAE